MRRSQHLIILAALAAALTGCVADNASVYIEANIIPEQQDVGCSVTSDGTPLTSGYYNLDYPAGYRIFPLYRNQLLSRATDVRADPNGVLIQGAEVTLTDQAGTPLALAGVPNPFTIAASTFIHSGDVGQPGQAVGELEVIPDAYRSALIAAGAAGTILAKVKIFGRTSGNIDIQAGDWQWPINLCRDTCLFQCLGPDETTEVLACSPGQDFTSKVICTTTPAP